MGMLYHYIDDFFQIPAKRTMFQGSMQLMFVFVVLERLEEFADFGFETDIFVHQYSTILGVSCLNDVIWFLDIYPLGIS